MKIRNLFRSPGPVTLVKKIGDDVLVTVSIEDMQPANYIGFQLNFPTSIIAPVLVSGSAMAVQYEASETFGALDCDIQANYLKDENTLAEYIYFSKNVKNQAVSTMQASRVATFWFKALAAGTGEITITERKYGKIVPAGASVEYDSTADALVFALQEPEGPVTVVAKFSITVE